LKLPIVNISFAIRFTDDEYMNFVIRVMRGNKKKIAIIGYLKKLAL